MRRPRQRSRSTRWRGRTTGAQVIARSPRLPSALLLALLVTLPGCWPYGSWQDALRDPHLGGFDDLIADDNVDAPRSLDPDHDLPQADRRAPGVGSCTDRTMSWEEMPETIDNADAEVEALLASGEEPRGRRVKQPVGSVVLLCDKGRPRWRAQYYPTRVGPWCEVPLATRADGQTAAYTGYDFRHHDFHSLPKCRPCGNLEGNALAECERNAATGQSWRFWDEEGRHAGDQDESGRTTGDDLFATSYTRDHTDRIKQECVHFHTVYDSGYRSLQDRLYQWWYRPDGQVQRLLEVILGDSGVIEYRCQYELRATTDCEFDADGAWLSTTRVTRISYLGDACGSREDSVTEEVFNGPLSIPNPLLYDGPDMEYFCSGTVDPFSL